MSQEFEGSQFPTSILKQNSTGGLPAILHSQDKVEALEKAAASLGAELQKVRAERSTERFFWILALCALLNVTFFAVLPWGAAVIFLVFCLLGLIGLGQWLEVPFIRPHLERWFDKVMGKLPQPGETE